MIEQDPEVLHSNPGLFTDEVLAELNDSMAAPVYDGVHGEWSAPEGMVSQVLLCYGSPSDEFKRRRAMTSLTSFLYQLLEEHTVAEGDRAWTPEKAAKAEGPLDLARVEAAAHQILGLVGEVRAADERVAECAAAQAAPPSFPSAEASTEWAAAQAEAADKAKQAAVALRYGVADLAYTLGTYAATTFNYIARDAAPYPDVRALIRKATPPPSRHVMPAAKAKDIIKRFLDHWLHFDPSVHVRAGAKNLAGLRSDAGYDVELADGGVDPADPETLMPGALLADQERAIPPALRAAIPFHLVSAVEAVRLLLETDELAAIGARALGLAAGAHSPADQELLSGYFRMANSAVGLSASAGPELVAADRALFDSPQARLGLCALLRAPADTRAAAHQVLSAPAAHRAAICALPADSAVRRALENVAPQDTFHRWDRFDRDHTAAINAVTKALYPERGEVDLIISLLKHLTGTQSEVEAQYQAFCDKWQGGLPSRLLRVTTGKPVNVVSVGPDRADRIDYFNKNTGVLRSMSDRQKADERIGEELLRHRVKVAKAENTAEVGPDADGLEAYVASRADMAGSAHALGAQRLTREARLRIARAKGDLKAVAELECLDEMLANVKRLGGEDFFSKTASEQDAIIQKLEGHDRDVLRAARRDVPLMRDAINAPEGTIRTEYWARGPDGTVVPRSMYTQSSEAIAEQGGAAAPPPSTASGKGPAAAAPAAPADGAASAVLTEAQINAYNDAQLSRLAPFAVEAIAKDMEDSAAAAAAEIERAGVPAP